MEWVEVRGETLEEAKEEALDQLGVALDDAEFEVVQEAESRWMGLKRTEARVRARVRPTAPAPKKDSGGNRRGRRRGGSGDGAKSGQQQKASGKGQRQSSRGRSGSASDGSGAKRGPEGGQARKKNGGGSGSGRAGSRDKQRVTEPPDDRSSDRKEGTVNDSAPREAVPLEEQREIVTTFLAGLVESFGVEGEVSTAMEDDVIIGSVAGSSELGLLIGPKGGTLRAIQELSRSAVQRQTDGRDTNRLMVDIAGYRERRRAALAAFAERQAARVQAEGVEVALEPMGSADRKAVHDAVLEIPGVRSISEGEDPHRRIVLVPDADDQGNSAS